MKPFRLAVSTVCPVPGEACENAGKMIRMIKKAARAGAGMIVFPEASLTGYSTLEAERLAVPADSEAASVLRAESARLGIAVCFGYLERDADRLYITQEIFSDGKAVRYRKTHLGYREKNVFEPGNDFPVADAGIETGMQLCWESHIPEISALERGKGAKLLLVPYAFPAGGKKCRENWDVHLPARASDNGVYAAACNLLFDDTGECSGADSPEKEAGQKAAVSDSSLKNGRKAIVPDSPPKVGRKGGGIAVYDPKGKRTAGYFGTQEHMILCDLTGPLPREIPEGNMHAISYFDRKRKELF